MSILINIILIISFIVFTHSNLGTKGTDNATYYSIEYLGSSIKVDSCNAFFVSMNIESITDVSDFFFEFKYERSKSQNSDSFTIKKKNRNSVNNDRHEDAPVYTYCYVDEITMNGCKEYDKMDHSSRVTVDGDVTEKIKTKSKKAKFILIKVQVKDCKNLEIKSIKKDKTGTIIIVVVVVGLVLLFTIVISVICICNRRARRKDSDDIMGAQIVGAHIGGRMMMNQNIAAMSYNAGAQNMNMNNARYNNNANDDSSQNNDNSNDDSRQSNDNDLKVSRPKPRGAGGESSRDLNPENDSSTYGKGRPMPPPTTKKKKK